jgi:hypothetical protein
MKKIHIISAVLLLVMLATTAVSQAQSTQSAGNQPKSDFFIGKWNLLISGFGDINMVLNLERKEGVLKGTIKMKDSQPVELTSIKEDEKDALNFSFVIMQDHVSTFNLKKKDENHLVGYSDGGANLTGERTR